MAIWKQILTSLVVIAVATAGWFRLDPLALERLQAVGIAHPVLGQFAHIIRSDDSTGAIASGSTPADGRAGGGGFRGSRTVTVLTSPVVEAVVDDRVHAIGDGEALRSVTITPTVAGTLAEIAVSSGQKVSKGAIIARLDDEAEKISADRARITLENAESKLQRYRELNNSAVISDVEIKNTELEVKTAQLALRQAEFELSRRTILAPISGYLGIISVNQGDYITPNSTIATIDDRSEILVDFRVPERFSNQIALGGPVEAVALALPNRVFEGSVSAIDNRIEAVSRTLRVRAQLNNQRDQLRAGMSFSVTMRFPGEVFPAVDPLSVQWDSQGSFVWRVVAEKAERVPVRIVQRNPEFVLVEADLAIGDAIVSEGIQRVRPGITVKAEPANPALPSPLTSDGEAPIVLDTTQQGAPEMSGETIKVNRSPSPGKGT